MKKIITAILILVAFSVQAQDSSYNAAIKFNMTDSIENGITFQRKAFFEAMVYNQRVNNISLQFTIEFYNTAGTKKMGLVKPYSREVIVGTKNYVVSTTGVFVGNIATVLSLYGKPDGNGSYLKLAGSQFYDLTTACMTEYDWFTKQIDATNKISQVIKNIGQREAAAGRLQ